MSTNFTQLLISIAIITIFVLLWGARRESFARIGNSWNYILPGFAFLVSAEMFNFAVRFLVQQGRMSAAAAEPLIAAGHTGIVLGLLLTAFGVHRWLSTVQDMCIESAVVKKRNFYLRDRVSRDGMLLSTVPAALYRTSGILEAGTSEISFVNDKIEDLLGYSKAEFEADSTLFASLMHDDDKKAFETERRELWHQDRIVVEHRFRHRDGEYRWLRRHLERVGGDGTDLTEWHGCVFDITDLKQAEARLTNFLEAAPDPVITTDKKGKIVLVNAQAERLYGYSKAELFGQYAQILIPERHHDHHLKRFSSYLTATTTQTIDIGTELVGQHKDGTEFPVEIAVNPIESGNEQLLAFAIRDISARQSVEAQLRQSQKMEVIGQLTGGIAHDFNNMLTVVIGNLQLLERRATEDEVTGHAARAAMDASMRAAELVKRLLAFSRRQLLAPKNTYINDLVTEIEPLLVRTISETVNLKTRLADELWLARIDPSQLENSLLNLAINARDALSSGGTLTIETSNAVLDENYATQHKEVKPGEYVLIAVSDNGNGISKEILSHVFEPFFSTKEVGKGTGLGLSMVYGFVKQSQGHIKIYSEEGHGTTIKIYIPRSKSDHADNLESTTRSKAIPGGNETILLAEDDDGVREIAISLLSSLGYRVLKAESGQEALKLIAENDDIALLFTDIVMPGGMTGAELAKRAIGSNPDLKVLYTSGYTDTTVFDNGLLEKGCDVLSKPYRKERLAHSVRDILDRD